MAEKKDKEEATKQQGEAQVEHAQTAPDKHMEAEGMIARSNPGASAKEAEDREHDRPNTEQ